MIKKMKIVSDFPPNYSKIIERFPFVENKEDVVFTYGDKLFIPCGKTEVPKHLMVHEKTHVKQQGDTVEEWWDKYLTDDEFRFSQELEAYGNQYRFIIVMNLGSKRNKQALDALALDLSSPMYGSICSFGEAASKIRNKAKEETKIYCPLCGDVTDGHDEMDKACVEMLEAGFVISENIYALKK